MQRVRTELGYAYSIGASWGAGYMSPGLFEISGSTKSKSTAETIRTIKEELAKLRTGEVTEETEDRQGRSGEQFCVLLRHSVAHPEPPGLLRILRLSARFRFFNIKRR